MEIPYQLTRDDYGEFSCTACGNLPSLAGTGNFTLAWNLFIYIPLGVAAVGSFHFLAGYSGAGLVVLYVAVGVLVVPKRAFSVQDELADFISMVPSRIAPSGDSTSRPSW